MEFLSRLLTEDLGCINDSRAFRIEEDFIVNTSKGRIVVPKGSITDGASVPRFLWPLVGPFDSDIFKAAVVHDFLYRSSKSYKHLTRKDVDDLFLDGLESLGMVWWKRRLVYRGVRMCGWNSTLRI